MLIATWNVNSIRTRLEQVQEWLITTKPDLLCIQETKVEDKDFPTETFKKAGYEVNFHGQKSYNGVALISPYTLEDIKRGFSSELNSIKVPNELEGQSRIISALIQGIRVVNVYVPNGSALNSEKFDYKLKWLKLLKQYLQSQAERNEPLCLVGDFNIAPKQIDMHDPNRSEGGIMASKEERSALKELLGERLEDVFRLFEPVAKNWTWWDYRSAAWERDRGWRIDHIYLSKELINNAKSCVIHKSIRAQNRPSDHVPVVVELNWPPDQEEFDDNFSAFMQEL